MSYPNQPGMPGAPAGGQAPANNLVLAIVSLFCCWPLGIPAIVFAAQVNGKWAQGDAAGAQASADKAKNFAKWAFILGVIGWVLAIIIDVVVIAGASNT